MSHADNFDSALDFAVGYLEARIPALPLPRCSPDCPVGASPAATSAHGLQMEAELGSLLDACQRQHAGGDDMPPRVVKRVTTLQLEVDDGSDGGGASQQQQPSVVLRQRTYTTTSDGAVAVEVRGGDEAAQAQQQQQGDEDDAMADMAGRAAAAQLPPTPIDVGGGSLMSTPEGEGGELEEAAGVAARPKPCAARLK